MRDCSTVRSDRLHPLGEDRAPPARAAVHGRISHRGSPSPHTQWEGYRSIGRATAADRQMCDAQT